MDAKHADSQLSSVRSSWFKRNWAIYPLLTSMLVVGASASSQRAAKVEWRQGQLSVTAENMPLAEVIHAVASKVGIEVVELQEYRQQISVELSDLTLHDGLRTLLADVNYILIENTSARERQREQQQRPALIVVLGGRVLADPVDASKNLADDNEAALRRALDDPDPDSQALALDLIAERNHDDAVTALVEATQSSIPEVRLRAIDLLVNSRADDQTILSALGQAITDQQRDIRSYAIRTLAQRSSPEGLGYLQTALVDPDPGIRMLTLDNVFRFVPPAQGIPLLQDAATLDRNEAVRSMASSLLAEATAARERRQQ